MADHQTIHHNEIRQWAEERGAVPSVVGVTHDEEGSGILRLDMPGDEKTDGLQEVSWDEFFAIFEDRELAMAYQDETSDGDQSYFSKFVSRPS